MSPSSKPPPSGVWVPCLLFFNPDESLCFPLIRSHILRLAQGGVHGLLIQGSNGEAMHLTHQERSQVIQFARKTLDENGFQNVAIMAGTGTNSTRETLELCVRAKEDGAGWVIVLPPSYWVAAMTKENLIKFFTDVANESPLGVLIYNFPMVVAGIDVDSDTLEKLAQHPNIVGVKLSDANIGKVNRLVPNLSQTEQFAVYPGKSDVFLNGLLAGSAGTIAALVNFAPRAHIKLWKLAREEKKWEEANKLQYLLSRADWEIGKSGGVSGLKAAVGSYFDYGLVEAEGSDGKARRVAITRRPLKTLGEELVKVNGPLKKALDELYAIETS